MSKLVFGSLRLCNFANNMSSRALAFALQVDGQKRAESLKTTAETTRAVMIENLNRNLSVEGRPSVLFFIPVSGAGTRFQTSIDKMKTAGRLAPDFDRDLPKCLMPVLDQKIFRPDRDLPDHFDHYRAHPEDFVPIAIYTIEGALAAARLLKRTFTNRINIDFCFSLSGNSYDSRILEMIRQAGVIDPIISRQINPSGHLDAFYQASSKIREKNPETVIFLFGGDVQSAVTIAGSYLFMRLLNNLEEADSWAVAPAVLKNDPRYPVLLDKETGLVEEFVQGKTVGQDTRSLTGQIIAGNIGLWIADCQRLLSETDLCVTRHQTEKGYSCPADIFFRNAPHGKILTELPIDLAFQIAANSRAARICPIGTEEEDVYFKSLYDLGAFYGAKWGVIKENSRILGKAQ